MPFFHFSKNISLNILRYRNSRSRIIFKIGVLKNFTILAGKHLCWILFSNKVADPRPETPTEVFSCKYSEIFKNSFFIEHIRRLLLKIDSFVLYIFVMYCFQSLLMCFFLQQKILPSPNKEYLLWDVSILKWLPSAKEITSSRKKHA